MRVQLTEWLLPQVEELQESNVIPPFLNISQYELAQVLVALTLRDPSAHLTSWRRGHCISLDKTTHIENTYMDTSFNLPVQKPHIKQQASSNDVNISAIDKVLKKLLSAVQLQAKFYLQTTETESGFIEGMIHMCAFLVRIIGAILRCKLYTIQQTACLEITDTLKVSRFQILVI